MTVASPQTINTVGPTTTDGMEDEGPRVARGDR